MAAYRDVAVTGIVAMALPRRTGETVAGSTDCCCCIGTFLVPTVDEEGGFVLAEAEEALFWPPRSGRMSKELLRLGVTDEMPPTDGASSSSTISLTLSDEAVLLARPSAWWEGRWCPW
jgi:hypothetical protein